MKKNIVFMGAPSSGKTTLCKYLANHFEEPWMHELGKQYWLDNQVNRRLTQKQLLEIAQLHILGEDKNMEEAKEFLFTDTNITKHETYVASYLIGDQSFQGRKCIYDYAGSKFSVIEVFLFND